MPPAGQETRKKVLLEFFTVLWPGNLAKITPDLSFSRGSAEATHCGSLGARVRRSWSSHTPDPSAYLVCLSRPA